MLDLREREWKPFYFNEIFTQIQRGKRLKKADHRIGNQPYVSSSAANSGVDGFISNSEKVRKFNNCLTIANSGSVGSTFYHRYTFVASDHVTQLKNPDFNRYVYLFLAPVVSRLAEKYSFNREINDLRINKEILLLPVDDNGKPDWEYMGGYIRNHERNLTQSYLEYAKEIIKECDVQDVVSLHEKEWREFSITNYFVPQRGREGNMASLAIGNTPLISAKKVDNGLKAFVCIPEERLHTGHAITLNNDGDGGAGLAYYQPFSFALDTHVTSLRPKEQISKYALIFVSSSITKQSERFGHGHAISDKRLRKMKIMLPITSDGEPDWEYMGQYTKLAFRHKLMKYLEYKKSDVNEPKTAKG